MVPIWGVTWLLRWILENPVSQGPRYFSTVEKKDPGVSLSQGMMSSIKTPLVLKYLANSKRMC